MWINQTGDAMNEYLHPCMSMTTNPGDNGRTEQIVTLRSKAVVQEMTLVFLMNKFKGRKIMSDD
jgi:hypothetical protein